MKIAVIGHHIPSHKAHSVNTVKMAEGFYLLGHDVEVLIVKRFLETINRFKFKNIHEFYGVNKGIKFKYFTDKTFSFFTEARYLRGISRNLLKILKKIVPRIEEFFGPYKKISTYCKINRIDLCFCRDTEIAAYYNILNKIPTLIESHYNAKLYINPNMEKLFNLSRNKSFKALITIHNVLKKYFMNYGIPEEKILVHEDVADLSEFDKIVENKLDLRKKLNLPLNKKIILYTGHMRKEGGIKTIFEAANLLKNENYCYYLIGGDKHQIKFWKNYLVKNNIDVKVNIIGFKPHKIIPYYLKAADILLAIYSKDDPVIKYISPMKLFEYMASKTPIIASKWKRISEILNNDECIFTKLDDPKNLSKKIKHLITDKELQNKLTKNAYNKSRNFTYKKRCQKIIKFIS